MQKTDEQNKDANGNIKIHEQGTANVNIVNVSPIPVVQVGSGSATLPYKVIKLFDNQTINQNQTLSSNFVHVEGYRKIALYVNEINSPSMYVYGQFSVDGNNSYFGTRPPGTLSQFTLGVPAGQPSYVMSADDVLGSDFRVVVNNQSNQNFPTSATFTATVYLIP